MAFGFPDGLILSGKPLWDDFEGEGIPRKFWFERRLTDGQWESFETRPQDRLEDWPEAQASTLNGFC